MNPVARTNVCPEYGKPTEPVLYAFSYTVPAPQAARGSFIIAGGAEARDRIELRDKVRYVVGEMERSKEYVEITAHLWDRLREMHEEHRTHTAAAATA